MEFDNKQKILIAIYLEYQKDLPQMENVTFQSIGLENDVFKVAVEKLVNEGLVHDVEIIHGGNGTIPLGVRLKHGKMTNYGIDYVERKLGIDNIMTGQQKVKSVFDKAASWSWDQIKDIAAKVLAEMMKS